MNYVWAFLFVPIYQVYWKISRIESHLTQAGEKKKNCKGKGKNVSDSLRYPFIELSYPFLRLGNHCLILTNCFSIFHDKQSQNRCCSVAKLVLNRFWSYFFGFLSQTRDFCLLCSNYTQKVTSWSDVHPGMKLKCNCVFIILSLFKRLERCFCQKKNVDSMSITRELCLFDFYQIKFFSNLKLVSKWNCKILIVNLVPVWMMFK